MKYKAQTRLTAKNSLWHWSAVASAQARTTTWMALKTKEIAVLMESTRSAAQSTRQAQSQSSAFKAVVAQTFMEARTCARPHTIEITRSGVGQCLGRTRAVCLLKDLARPQLSAWSTRSIRRALVESLSSNRYQGLGRLKIATRVWNKSQL